MNIGFTKRPEHGVQSRIGDEKTTILTHHAVSHENYYRKNRLQEVLKNIVQDSCTKPWLYLDHLKVPQSGE